MGAWDWLLILFLGWGLYELSSNVLVLPYEHDAMAGNVKFNECYYGSIFALPIVGLELVVFSMYKLHVMALRTLNTKLEFPRARGYFRVLRGELRHGFTLLRSRLNDVLSCREVDEIG